MIAKRVEEFETGTQIDLVTVFEVDRELWESWRCHVMGTLAGTHWAGDRTKGLATKRVTSHEFARIDSVQHIRCSCM